MATGDSHPLAQPELGGNGLGASSLPICPTLVLILSPDLQIPVAMKGNSGLS